MPQTFSRMVAVVGGCGHVGLPLALMFADSGFQTVIFDINKAAVESVKSGKVPFQEDGAPEMLQRVLAKQTLSVTDTPNSISECKYLVFIVGTPVDEHLNPSFSAIHKAIEQCRPFLRDGQVLVLRSTVYPGVTSHIEEYLMSHGHDIGVAYCPERVARGFSLREFRELPQIISATRPETLKEVAALFEPFVPELIEMTPIEAELTKLMSNAWRYIQFATVNQFYMIASQHGLDFNRVLQGCKHNYPRMRGIPGPGFAAGPCLVKDTMQLAAFSQNNFVLGHAAMLVNEGLPAHLVRMTKEHANLRSATVGILGMTFKANCDDPRDSLSYKLRKILTLECKKVICHDPYIQGVGFHTLDKVLAESNILFVGTPHAEYKGLAIPEGCLVVDIWNTVAPQVMAGS